MTRDEIQHELRHATADLALQVRHIRQNIIKVENVVKLIPDYSPMTRCKNTVVVREMVTVPWHSRLIDIFCWTCDKWPGQVVVTSGYRHGEKGVHGCVLLRGIDLRSREFNNPRNVEHEINQEWDYGKEPYQVCLYHQTVRCEKCKAKFEVDPDIGVIASTACPKCHAGGGFLRDFGPHFHLQSRDQTRKRK